MTGAETATRARRRRRADLASPLQHRLALGTKLVARRPLGQHVGFRHAMSDGEEDLEILGGAAQIPVWPHDVGRLVVIALGVLRAHLLAKISRLVDELDALVGIQRW